MESKAKSRLASGHNVARSRAGYPPVGQWRGSKISERKLQMVVELRLRIILESPPIGVDFGLQQGKGNDYRTVQTQRSHGEDLAFEGTVTVKNDHSRLAKINCPFEA
jgi:Family of unknown function (DUF5990)